jgi:hypothetical protein
MELLLRISMYVSAIALGFMIFGITIYFIKEDYKLTNDKEPRFYVNCGNGEPFSGGDQYFEFYHDIFRVYDMKDGKIINDEYHDISLVEERSDNNRTVKTYYCETDQRKFDLVNDNGEYSIRWRDDDGYVWLVVTKCD